MYWVNLLEWNVPIEIVIVTGKTGDNGHSWKSYASFFFVFQGLVVCILFLSQLLFIQNYIGVDSQLNVATKKVSMGRMNSIQLGGFKTLYIGRNFGSSLSYIYG